MINNESIFYYIFLGENGKLMKMVKKWKMGENGKLGEKGKIDENGKLGENGKWKIDLKRYDK